ncbi:MAG TPA: WecB/TagA/CpsF family glycosyltransferase [Patescibacteria group bacterium]
MHKKFLDIPIDWVDPDALERKIKLFVTTKQPHHIVTVNPEFIVVSRGNETFRTALQEADLSLPDGTGIVLGQTFFDKPYRKSKLTRLGQYLALCFQFVLYPHSFTYKRITGVDLTDRLLQMSAAHGWRVYLLGANPGIAAKAAEVWTSVYPELKIVGTSSSDPEDKNTIPDVKAAQPDILIVAYGSPKQELFIYKNKAALKVPVMVGVGGTFDTAAGTRYNPPKWIKFLGFEWLTYLITQPKRYRRIWRSTITFSNLIISSKSLDKKLEI